MSIIITKALFRKSDLKRRLESLKKKEVHGGLPTQELCQKREWLLGALSWLEHREKALKDLQRAERSASHR